MEKYYIKMLTGKIETHELKDEEARMLYTLRNRNVHVVSGIEIITKDNKDKPTLLT